MQELLLDEDLMRPKTKWQCYLRVKIESNH